VPDWRDRHGASDRRRDVFRDLPDLIYRMLSQVSVMRERTDAEIAAMKVRELPSAHAHHLMVEAIRAYVLPASRLPKVLEAWEEPKHTEFSPRTAWSPPSELALGTSNAAVSGRSKSSGNSRHGVVIGSPTRRPPSLEEKRLDNAFLPCGGLLVRYVS
jgi:hypothetical protein